MVNKCFKHIGGFGLFWFCTLGLQTYLVSLIASLACWYSNEITHYSVQPNNSVNILLQNPDIRLKQIIWFKSSIRFLINRIPFWTIRLRIYRTEYRWQNIQIRFLIAPIGLTPTSWRCWMTILGDEFDHFGYNGCLSIG